MHATRTLIPTLALLTLTLTACERRQAESADASNTPAAAPRAMPASTKVVTLEVDDMVCKGCVGDVREALMAIPGVVAAEVTLETKLAVVTLDASNAPDEASLCKTLSEAGHEARVIQTPPKGT
jgi:copper chaperone CopZ